MIKILVALVTFLLLVTVHEFGHFSFAKLVGIRVDEFSVGLGPKIFQKRRGETIYSFRLLPIGGYCALAGEDGEEQVEVTEEEKKRYFNNVSAFRRFLTILGGPLVNIICGVLFVYLYLVLFKGVNIFSAITLSFSYSLKIMLLIFDALKGLITGTVGFQSVSGPVGVIKVIGSAFSHDFGMFIYLIGVLSLNLAFFNLLPIPALDGSKLLLLVIEMFTKKKLPQKIENIIMAAGFVFLLGLILIVSIKDIVNLF